MKRKFRSAAITGAEIPDEEDSLFMGWGRPGFTQNRDEFGKRKASKKGENERRSQPIGIKRGLD